MAATCPARHRQVAYTRSPPRCVGSGPSKPSEVLGTAPNTNFCQRSIRVVFVAVASLLAASESFTIGELTQIPPRSRLVHAAANASTDKRSIAAPPRDRPRPHRLLAYNYTTAQPCGSSPSSAPSDGGSWGSNGISESSSGKLFHAVKVRTYSGERLFAKWQPGPKPSGPSKALRPKSGPQCKNWAVTTTIFPPTKTVNQIAALPDWCLVIAGDKKAPTQYNVSGGAIYLSPADQERMPFATGKLLRWNHFGRKNLGFLYAVQHGARWVYDTDDDNELQSMSQGIPIPRPNALVDEVQTSFKLYNLYPQMSTVPSAWPRGFPLEHVKDNRTFKASFTRRAWPARRVGVVQSLADHDPDVDGIYRLTQPLPFIFPPASTRAAGNKDGRRLEAVVSDEEAAAQAAEEEARRRNAIKAIASGLQQAPAAAKRLLSPTDDGRRLKANGGKKRSVDGAFMTLAAPRHDDAIQCAGDAPFVRRAVGAALAVHRPRARHRHLARVLHAAAAVGRGLPDRLLDAVGHAA